jgi:hypothetical protein
VGTYCSNKGSNNVNESEDRSGKGSGVSSFSLQELSGWASGAVCLENNGFI